MIRRVPLIVILGSTGTGKTKLSLELAERFFGEIISADSMQVYSKLDIVTAKATKAEQAKAKHHLLDVAKPGEAFTVVSFRDAALPIIDDLLSKSKCPIVVGGTNYYIESLLWNILVVEDSHGLDETKSKNVRSDYKITENLLETKKTSEELHVLLKKVDPVTANRIHPNNRRKIIRALEVYQRSGETLSSIFESQRSAPGGNRLGGPLRFPHIVLFWLRCNQEILNERLEKRVDSMLELGLLPEIRSFYNDHLIGSSCENQYTKGILQTIGLKEFIPYLEQFNEEDDIKNESYLKANSYKIPETDDGNDRPKGLDVLKSCLGRLKLVTNRYSKKQIKWIRNRFLSSVDRQVPDLYALDTSDVSQWDSKVYLPAIDVIESYMNGTEPKMMPLAKLEHPGSGLNEETSNFCPTCERIFIGEFQWRVHLKSNKHKRKQESLRKKEKLAAKQQDGTSNLPKSKTE